MFKETHRLSGDHFSCTRITRYDYENNDNYADITALHNFYSFKEGKPFQV